MSPEISKRLPTPVLKAIESGAVDLLWKIAQGIGWAALIWVCWSMKTLAKSYIDVNVDNHPTVLLLKAQEIQTRIDVVAAQSGVVTAQAAAKETSISLERIERVMNDRFDKSDAQIGKLSDRIDRHIESSK